MFWLATAKTSLDDVSEDNENKFLYKLAFITITHFGFGGIQVIAIKKTCK